MLLLLTTAVTLGALHTIAPDHLAAVSVFVSRRPGWRRAVAYGARWGLGHSITILLVGLVVLLSQLRLPAAFEANVDRVVGVVLIGLGAHALWRAWRAWRLDGAAVTHAHPHHHAGGLVHAHGHTHTHGEGHGHSHVEDGRKLLGIGMLHGLAGSGALVVALPAAAAQSTAGSLGYLAAFGVGTIVAMSALAAALGAVVHAASAEHQRVERIAVAVAGAASVGVGIWWMLR
jgi:ABC-type nickel/cobalt efflux system permease component RcnA